MTESLHDPLVLELKLPELETPVSQQVFLEALSKQLPHFVSWFISFAILCRLWIAQHALLEQGEQGVRVKILTNSLSSTDVAVVHAGYSKYRKDLLRMGVELYELKNI